MNRSLSRRDFLAASAASATSSRGAAVAAFARARVGYPYVYGATGPSAFDCSGLTSAAYASIGVGIPRTSQAQFGAGRSVSLDALQTLPFFGGGKLVW